MTAYDATSIRILEPVEAADRWGWLRIESLATQYKRPAAWIGRGLEACRRAGVDESYFVARYLERLPVDRLEAVDEAMRELSREALR